ncbi:hypothetical protein MKEN_00000700 [Mycena kentingensis (nom. inval.)]|nr:hypothetical protein MKEN_00000700 [Mycena kentingensis (nom. inval.)]
MQSAQGKADGALGASIPPDAPLPSIYNTRGKHPDCTVGPLQRRNTSISPKWPCQIARVAAFRVVARITAQSRLCSYHHHHEPTGYPRCTVHAGVAHRDVELSSRRQHVLSVPPSSPVLPPSHGVQTTSCAAAFGAADVNDLRHLQRRLVRALLSEEGAESSWSSAMCEEWALAMESALDALSDGVARGRWLAGVKRARVRQASALDSDTLSISSASLLSIRSDLSSTPSTPDALSSLRSALAQPSVPSPHPEPRHLLLCVGGASSRILPSEDSGFDLVAATVGCLFRPNVFDLPLDDDAARDAILFGLEEWDDDLHARIVGGTFIFKGVTSPAQHALLTRILRLSIYTHLSLLLEQHFLADSGVQLSFPPPRPRPAIAAAVSYQPDLPVASPSAPRSGKDKTFLPGILSFFSKKNHGHAQSTTITPTTRAGTSLDLARNSDPLSRLSEDGSGRPGSRIRRFSLIASSLGVSPPPSISSAFTANVGGSATPFAAIHERLLASASLLSSSAGVRVPPPRLIVELAEREGGHDGDAKRRLKGDERVGLGSIRGWGDSKDKEGGAPTGKEAKAAGLLGARGFARMQEVGVLVSWGVPVPSGSTLTSNTTTSSASSASSVSSLSSASSSTSTLEPPPTASSSRSEHIAQCCPPRMQTLRFYARDGAPGSERSLGEVLGGWLRDAEGDCTAHEFFRAAAPVPRPKRRKSTRPASSAEGAEEDGGGEESAGEEKDKPPKSAASTATTATEKAKCAFKRGDHVLRMVHGGVRVEVRTRADDDALEIVKREEAMMAREASDGSTATAETGASSGTRVSASEDDEDRISTWISCSVCGRTTGRRKLSDGAFLFSFGKFLEVLVYSPSVANVALCEHTNPAPPSKHSAISNRTVSSASTDSTLTPTSSTTTPPSAASSSTPTQSRVTAASNSSSKTVVPPLPASRLNIVRHYAAHGHILSFSLTEVEDIFELRVPRLQITRRAAEKVGKGPDASIGRVPAPVEEEKKLLRKEIKAWWESVTDHMDKLETSLVGSTLVGFRKSLPRLPSEDDAWDDSASETDAETETSITPRGLRPGIAGLPPSAPTTPQIARVAQEFFAPPLLRASSDPVASPPDVVITDVPPPSASQVLAPDHSIELLSTLRQTFQRTEQELYAMLSTTPLSTLNDVRRAFLGKAKGAEKRLLAWQKKHLPGRGKRTVQMLLEGVREPEWWGKGFHVAPNCNVIIREDDWGSIIAFTMSTTDYARELGSMSLARPSSAAPLLTPATSDPPTSSSFFSGAANNLKLFSSASQALPDPDQEDAVWYEPEPYSAVISRKEHPRDATSLLSLREVLRQKSPREGVSILHGSSRFSSIGSAATKASSSKIGGSSIVPPSAWAKPAEVQVSRTEAGGEVVGMPDHPGESAGKILHGLDASSTEGGGHSRPASAMSGSVLSTSMFADVHIKRGKAASLLSLHSTSTAGSDSTVGGKDKEPEEAVPVATEEKGTDLPTPTPSSFHTLTSGITNAMRFMLNNGDAPRPSTISTKNHHGLLAPDSPAIDERPHIKYDWTVGKRLKFSCTVYYAKQFDNLRRRCGIEDVFVKSLSRSANWAAEGGKSKSNFWKTADDRFIIKTLVNAWNVADLQVLIELAPSYFRYMDATASRATVLAKLIGFYTIEIRNLETGNVQSKADLLVMENLFYDQKIHKTFDLKGIQGRKVKSKGGAGEDKKTLFDGEWIEGQQRTLTLIHPHSKAVLQEAIRSDADFLAKSNIMDYSLLLGVDQERKQISCGLVDTIGSYTFAKTLEYKAKQGLTGIPVVNLNLTGGGGAGPKEVTVIPPTEYQERFVGALERYFLACPDKWTRATDDSKPIDDPAMLPSVL